MALSAVFGTSSAEYGFLLHWRCLFALEMLVPSRRVSRSLNTRAWRTRRNGVNSHNGVNSCGCLHACMGLTPPAGCPRGYKTHREQAESTEAVRGEKQKQREEKRREAEGASERAGELE